MAEPFYSRPSLHVEIYATRSASMPVVEGDIDFYLELARNAPGPALELGCGTAYFSAWLQRRGARPVAVDVYPGNTDDPATVPDQVEKSHIVCLEQIGLGHDQLSCPENPIRLMKREVRTSESAAFC